LDYPRGLNENAQAVPRLGGLAVFLASAIIIMLAHQLIPSAQYNLTAVGPKLITFALGATAIVALGLIDDIRGLRARWKLLGELVIAVSIYYWGLRVEVITNPFEPEAPLLLGTLGLPLNVLWMLLAMNGMNLIDGLDGLAGGVFLLALVLLLSVSLLGAQFGLAIVTVSLLGATAAFLRHNYFAGSIFLGDSGSLLMGYCLACFVPLFSPKAAGMAAAVIPVAVLSVPIAEVAITATRRVWKGQPVGQPDQGHVHHRMMAGGMEKRRVVFFIQMLSLLCGLTALAMTFVYNRSLALLLGAVWVALLGLFLKVGYFKAKPQNGETKQSHAHIFLDMDRVLHRKVFKLKLASTRKEIDDRVADLGQDLGLASLRYRSRRDGEWTTLEWSSSETADNDQERMSLTLYSPDSFEPAWELSATLGSVSTEQSWPRLVNWLRGLAHSLTLAMDNVQPHPPQGEDNQAMAGREDSVG
jgi:UDP-GlcNAc:undecaprenyl-phosphate GlcNAc-1-phosphate transferase